jgi:AcrR family transcriptional regulator
MSEQVPARRSQADRSAATRDALVRAARPLFAEHGFAGVGTETIVAAAGVTRGAMYHQFADKTELFAAVFEAVEIDVTERLATDFFAVGETDPVAIMRLGARAWLDICAEPEVQRIVLVEAPAVLGWIRWREIGQAYGLGLVKGMIGGAMEAGRVPEQPVTPLAHVLMGALDEAALYIAQSEDPTQARLEMQAVLDRLVDGITI